MSEDKLMTKALELAPLQAEVYRGAVAHKANNYLQAVVGRLQLGIHTGQGLSIGECEDLLKRSDEHTKDIQALTLYGRIEL